MEICSEIIGNIHSKDWQEKTASLQIDYVPLDQWTAQKSRFLAKGESGIEYPVALKRQTQVVDGDIIYQDGNRIAVLKLELNPVLVLDLSSLKKPISGQNHQKKPGTRSCNRQSALASSRQRHKNICSPYC